MDNAFHLSLELGQQLWLQLESEFGSKAALEHVYHLAGYWRVPPTIDECIDDQDFLGTLVGRDLYPYWRSVLRQIFPNQFFSPFQELCLTGSTGYGKSMASRIVMFYDLIKLLCLEDPQGKFGIGRNTALVFALFGTTLTQSDSVLYREFREFIEHSPFCQQMRMRAKNPKRELLPHKIVIKSASRASQVLGMAVVGAHLSELNFQGEAQKLQAFKQYSITRTRRKTRFLHKESRLMPGHLILDSSRADSAAFLENHIKAVRKEPATLVIENAIWEVLAGVPGKDLYCGKKFSVFIGDESRDPKILEGPNATIGIPEALVIQVPVEYQSDFTIDIHTALRDLAGVSTLFAYRFFPNAKIVERALCQPNPCDLVEVELSYDELDDQAGGRLIDVIDVSKLDHSVPYCIHFDLGITSDRTGVALTKYLGPVQIQRNTPFLDPLIAQDNLFATDLVLAVVGKPGRPMSISKLKNFVINLQHAGIKIAAISADSYQSVALLQALSELGLHTETISCDKTKEPYALLKNAMIEQRWTGPFHEILQKELLELEDGGKKIDHPLLPPGMRGKFDRPSKDVADAVAGSLWLCNKLAGGNKSMDAFTAYVEHLEATKRETTVMTQLYELGLDARKQGMPPGMQGRMFY